MCKTGMSKRQAGAGAERRQGRQCDAAAAEQWARPAEQGVAWAGIYHSHTKTHAWLCYLHMDGIFSVWPTDIFDNNEPAC